MLGMMVLALLVFTPCHLLAQAEPTLFPIANGTYWVYQGEVQWTQVNSNKVSSQKVRWRMEVIETVERHKTTAALLKGHPSDLAWYSPETTRGESLLVQAGNRFYFLNGPRAWKLLQALKELGPNDDAQKLLDEHDIWFALPLRKGAKFCEPEQRERDDTFYCWFVAEQRSIRVANVRGVKNAAFREYKLEFRTLPEHEFVALVPGIGILSYDFSHHGTVAEAHVRLTEFGQGLAGTPPSSSKTVLSPSTVGAHLE